MRGTHSALLSFPFPNSPLPLSKGEFLHSWAPNFPQASFQVSFWCSFISRGASLGDPNQTRLPGVLEDPNLGSALLFAAHLGDTLAFQDRLPLPKPLLALSKGEFLHTWARSILGTLISLQPFIPGVLFWITAAPCSPGRLPWKIQSSPGPPRCCRTRIWEQLSGSRARGWEAEDGKDLPDQRKERNPVSQPGRMGKRRL